MTPQPFHYKIGLASSLTHQEGRDSALVNLFRTSHQAIERYLKPNFYVIEQTLEVMRGQGLLSPSVSIQGLPFGLEGGLMLLTSRIVNDDPSQAMDAVIYLMDPVDPTANYPEALALKRQCVIHGKPYLSTLAGAREWFELEAVAVGAEPDVLLDSTFDFANEGIALIAHDRMKSQMVALAEQHFDLLDRFAVRYATGTTGSLLNNLAEKVKGHTAGRNWVKPFLSGPLGGDAQIAELILNRRCRRVLFLEDPHVARQHEADIQLLERAVRIVTDYASCLSDVRSVARWLNLLDLRAKMKLRQC